MSCYHPKKAFFIKTPKDATLNDYIYEKTKNNKNKLYITDYNVKYIYLNKSGNWCKSYDDKPTKLAHAFSEEFIEIPCGHCIGCRLDQSKMWSARCMMEAEYHDENYFLTITYDEEHVPKTEYTSPETGEIITLNTLVKRDIQLFIKRLRKRLDSDDFGSFRYYLCGEYGTNTQRPHYHLICFGLHIPDLVLYKRDERGNLLYNSEYINSCWNKGFITIGSVTPESCSYTARYCTKKAYQDSNLYADLGIEPEFTLMSRRPGIAKEYFINHCDCLDYDFIYLSGEDGGIKIKPPRYFERLFESVNPLGLMERKMKSYFYDLSGSFKKGELSQTDKTYLDYLKTKEMIKERQIKSLVRSI